MPTHERLIKQLTKALGGSTRIVTGVNTGRTYRDFRRNKFRRGRVYVSNPYSSNRRRMDAFGRQLVGLLTELTRTRVGVYQRKRYTTGRAGSYTAARRQERLRNRGYRY